MSIYEEIAKNEANKNINRPGAIGILWVGSSSFGVVDDLVDVDIRIVTLGSVKSEPMQQYKINNIKVEVDELSLDWLVDNLELDSEQAWIIEKSVILFDPDHKLSSVIEEAKRKLSKLDNKKLLWTSYSKLYSHYDLEKSLQRNQIISAHIILSNILDSLSKFIFLVHNQIIPPQKWRIYFIRKDNLFNLDIVDKIIKLDMESSGQEIIALIKKLQLDCQKIMLERGYSQESVLEPWRF